MTQGTQDLQDVDEASKGHPGKMDEALFAVIVLAVSASLILAIILIPGQLRPEDMKDETLVLAGGDYFHYSVDWPDKTFPSPSFVNFTLEWINETSMASVTLDGNCPNGLTSIIDREVNINPFYSRDDGMWVRDEVIATPFGSRCVEVFLSVYIGGEVFLKFVGSESKVVYLMVAGGVGDEYSVELVSSNNTSLRGLDDEFNAHNPLEGEKVTDGIGGACGLDLNSGTIWCGALNVEQGDKVRYELDGDYISAWFLSMDDIEKGASCHRMAFNSSLSTSAGNPGSYSFDCEPGIYLYILHVGHCNYKQQHFYIYWKPVEI
jgi:hypothetical protein